ncbi:DMT family transporter [Agromyces albus]|uniref:QacE family quaternary ammonium compound efflux SMR transporter n=1 Tax=Agromyces albus TaxID=205332 RepID=A0A4Q2KS48_9MICO|nr:SMR family transporter [Agromyces albus]RXZ68258.1 QacE family quaternary ammonium compound efflux SMR transporter [Agromyces albus]
MKKWLILSAAIALEVTATLSLRAAIDSPWWAILAVAGYAGAFVALSVLLRLGAPIGTVYGIWAATGVALTAVIASVVFGEPFTFTIGLGIAIVIVGVVLVETGQARPPSPAPAPAVAPETDDAMEVSR